MTVPVALSVHRMDTPIGALSLVASERGLCFVAFEDGWDKAEQWLARRFGDVVYENRTTSTAVAGEPGAAAGAVAAAAAAFRAYFAGDVTAVDRVATDTGGTEFQRRVWAALRAVPAGATTSYADIARAIGKPSAVRAVGRAIGQNPVSIAIPCHRVIGIRGALTGYGGGLDRKRWLLEHEGALLALGAVAGA